MTSRASPNFASQSQQPATSAASVMYRRQFVSPLLKRPLSETAEEPESLEKRARLNVLEPLRETLQSRTPLLNLQVPNYSPTGRQPGAEGYWNVLWRNQTTKKNKTWDGDGVLSLEDGFLTLKDSDGKKCDPRRIDLESRVNRGRQGHWLQVMHYVWEPRKLRYINE
jgi:hypothetical protein